MIKNDEELKVIRKWLLGFEKILNSLESKDETEYIKIQKDSIKSIIEEIKIYEETQNTSN